MAIKDIVSFLRSSQRTKDDLVSLCRQFGLPVGTVDTKFSLGSKLIVFLCDNRSRIREVVGYTSSDAEADRLALVQAIKELPKSPGGTTSIIPPFIFQESSLAETNDDSGDSEEEFVPSSNLKPDVHQVELQVHDMQVPGPSSKVDVGVSANRKIGVSKGGVQPYSDPKGFLKAVSRIKSEWGGGRHQSLLGYFREVQFLIDLFNPPTEFIFVALNENLKGEALSWYKSFRPFVSYAEFLVRFKRAFLPLRADREIERSIRSATQGLRETFEGFYARINLLNKDLSIPLPESKLLELAMDQAAPIYRYHWVSLSSDKAEDLDEVLAAARRIEDAVRAEKQFSKLHVAATEVSGEQIGDGESRKSPVQVAAVTNTPTMEFKGRCFACGKQAGHMARQCPDRRPVNKQYGKKSEN